MLALVAVALCACSSDDIALTESAVTPAIGGDGYMSLAINLPTQASTRAANDVYDDGLPSEYAVNDATLLLFAGESESTATCYATYDLTYAFDLESANDNITSRSQVTQQIDTPESGNLYALVILNGTGMESYISGGYVGKTLADLQTTSVECGISAMTSNGFYMANAPLINATGANATSGTVTTLATVDQTKIYATEEKAAENVAAEIYVERGMAKVTVDASQANTSVTLGDQTIDVTINGYALDLTNNVTYPVRNTTTASAETDGASWWALASGSSAASTADLYRFAGTTIVDNNGLYRTYWAEDPNYNTTPYDGGDEGSRNYGTTMNYLTDLSFTGGLGDEHPQYCLENTFSVARQNQDETTRAIVQATFGEADFYIWNKNHSVLYDWNGIDALVLSALEGNEAIEEAVAIYADEIVNFYDHFTVSLEETSATDDATIVIEITTEFTEDEFKDPETGYTPYDVPTVCTQDGLDEVVASINATHTVGYYQGGVSYYPVLIKHFGDDLTPWDEATVLTGDEGTYTPDPENYNTSYPGGIWNTTADDNWLGRYGVLRNNWYDLNITNIAEPGYATPPSATGKPDDPVELWISVRINILSWAKRTQDVTL